MAKVTFRYTEQELKDRLIGDFVDGRDGEDEDRAKYSIKYQVYKDEGVHETLNKLRRSFHPFLQSYYGAKPAIEKRLSNKCAQLMIDGFLLRRSRGEDVKAPCEIRSIETVVLTGKDKATDLELYDPSLFDDNDSLSENDMIRWVNKNMLVAGIEAEDAPCSAAFGMLLHYRKTASRREKFYDTQVPKLLSKEDAAKGDKLKDDGKDAVELCKRLLAALPEEVK